MANSGPPDSPHSATTSGADSAPNGSLTAPSTLTTTAQPAAARSRDPAPDLSDPTSSSHGSTSSESTAAGGRRPRLQWTNYPKTHKWLCDRMSEYLTLARVKSVRMGWFKKITDGLEANAALLGPIAEKHSLGDIRAVRV